MKNMILFLTSLLLVLPALAIDTDWGNLGATSIVVQTDWQKLTTKAAQSSRSSKSEYGTFKILAHLTDTDTTKPRVANYFSALGGANSKGVFQALSYTAVSEDWKIDEKGNWTVDQWIYSFRIDGTIVESYHINLVEMADGSIISNDQIPTTKEEFQVHWDKLFASWVEWIK